MRRSRLAQRCSPAAPESATIAAPSSIRRSTRRSSRASTIRIRSPRRSAGPSFTGQFSENDWYYLSRDTNTVAFRNPRVVDQTVLHVRFDQAGNVAAVNRTGKELIASINPENDHTPTLGRKKSFFEEFFGGIGQIGSGGAAPPDPATRQ